VSVEYSRITIGGLTRAQLLSALLGAGVGLNQSAETLLESEAFDENPTETIQPVALSVGELGLTSGASLSQIITSAQGRGLAVFPLMAAPYLRLAMLHQETAPDSAMSGGRVPSGSITVASAPPRPGIDDYPTGFYLRAVDGIRWLRGYRCTDEYIWPSAAQFTFRYSTFVDLTERAGQRVHI
jgi:hypothetical protein